MKIKIGSIVRVLVGVYCLYTGMYILDSKNPTPKKDPERFSIPDGDDVNYRALFSVIKQVNSNSATYAEQIDAFDKVLKMAKESKDNKFKSKCIEGLTFISTQNNTTYALHKKALEYIDKIKESAIPENKSDQND